MLDKLKQWYELLSIDGKGTKQIVREDIAKMIQIYQEAEDKKKGN